MIICCRRPFLLRRTHPCGFLLLAVVGLLALLLVLCVGFLSYTRTEVRAVTHQRDKVDARDVSQSALDWMLASISSHLIKADGTFDSTKYVSNASGPTGLWWYKPWQAGGHLQHWSCPALEEAPWVYLPADYFPAGDYRARISVQVLDTNCALNLNDWLQDCSPSQCQMAHMLGGALWNYQHERARFAVGKLGTNNTIVRAYVNSAAWNTEFSGSKPFRYRDCWRYATRTVRPTDYNTGTMPPNWITTNTSWFWASSTSHCTYRPMLMSESPPLEINGTFFPWNKTSSGDQIPQGYALNWFANVQPLAYVDPDTGRSPVNVNTVYLDDRTMWTSEYSYSHVMEGVFNIDALRRIIKIGKFYHEGKEYDTQVPDPVAANNAWRTQSDSPQWQTHERLRSILAQQYQETLVRYFTARYSKGGTKTSDNWAAGVHGRLFPMFSTTPNRNYVQTYGSVLSDAAAVTSYCTGNGPSRAGSPSNDPAYTVVRFPFGLEDFRNRVKADLITMTKKNGNTTANNNNPTQAGLYKTGVEAPPTLDEIVDCDEDGDFSVLPGKLDKRVATAVFDNIVPGKALLFPTSVPLIDPLKELFALRIGRDENLDSQHNPYGLHSMDKGLDIALNSAPDGPYKKVAEVPDRQLVFGPDWFSTELTTTSTTFVFVVRAQIVDGKSADLNAPRVLEERNFSTVVELAPDVLDETSALAANPADANGDLLPDSGLGYYRGDWPRKRKISPDIMDKGCATLPPTPYSATTIAPWTDYRNFAPADYAGPKQIKKNVVIRATLDLSNTF
jgi:hypothetical protein